MSQKCQEDCSQDEMYCQRAHITQCHPKDGTLPLIVPTSQVYIYKVQLKWIDSVPPMMSEVGHKMYKVGDPV